MKYSLIFVIICIFFVAQTNCNMPDKVEAFFFKFIDKVIPLLNKFDVEMDFLKILKKLHILTPSQVCSKCMSHYGGLKQSPKVDEFFEKEIMKLVDDICPQFLNKVECDGVVALYIPIFFKNWIQYKYEPKFACGSQSYCDNGYSEYQFEDYYNEIMKDKKTVEYPKPTWKGTYKVVQINDNHFDDLYQEGREGKCDETDCCTQEQDMATPGSTTAAGYWGVHAVCDLPKKTLEEAFNYIRDEINPSYILWTGDSNDHRIWDQKKEDQTKQMKEITEQLKRIIPSTIPIYPMFGNHEAFPIDNYDFMHPENYNLFEQGTEIWKEWLDEEGLKSMKKNGYYSQINKEHNIKIISLYTELCNVQNYYMMPYPVDPLNQLEWLRSEFYDAEEKNMAVVIQGHIPMSNGQVSSTWSRRYNALMERFGYLVRAQVFAHTHTDFFSFYRNQKTGEPVSMAFTAPALSSYSNHDPTIRVYEFDSETHVLVNVYNHRISLAQANIDKAAASPLKWSIISDYVSDYGLQNYTSIAEMTKLSDRLSTDLDTLEKYAFNYNAGSQVQSREQLEKEEKWKYIYQCTTKYTVFEDVFACLKEYIAEQLEAEGLKAVAEFTKVWYYFKDKNGATPLIK